MVRLTADDKVYYAMFEGEKLRFFGNEMIISDKKVEWADILTKLWADRAQGLFVILCFNFYWDNCIYVPVPPIN